MNDRLKVEWQVNDGYVTGARPQTTIVSREEIRRCGNVDDAMRLIHDAVRDDFEQKIDWTLDADVEDDVKDILAGNS